MKKQELGEFLKGLAQAAMEEMIQDGGSYPQRAVVKNLKGDIHCVVMPGEPLHGHVMATMLRLFAEHVGGADVIAVASDARLNATTREEWSRRPEGYSIAKDESNPECLIVSGRTQGHSALIMNPYTRTKHDGKKDTITFEHAEPTIEDRMAKLNLVMIPNVWETVH
jgi:hypothetical protein